MAMGPVHRLLRARGRVREAHYRQVRTPIRLDRQPCMCCRMDRRCGNSTIGTVHLAVKVQVGRAVEAQGGQVADNGAGVRGQIQVGKSPLGPPEAAVLEVAATGGMMMAPLCEKSFRGERGRSRMRRCRKDSQVGDNTFLT